jgi:hypothetical protein
MLMLLHSKWFVPGGGAAGHAQSFVVDLEKEEDDVLGPDRVLLSVLGFPL